MKRWQFSVVLILFILLLLCIPTFAADTETFEEAGFTYCIENNEATILSYTYASDDTEIVIPDTLGGYPVTKLGDGLFCMRYWITSVHIPETVRVIGESCFSCCMRLQQVNIPSSTEEIGDNAFRDSAISFDKLELSAKTIGSLAFDRIKINTLILNEGLETLGHSAFQNSKIHELQLPSTLRVIPGYAFYNNSITNLTIPEGVTQIQTMAFCDCKIETISLPSTLKVLDSDCLGKNNFSEINLPDGLEVLGEGTFYDCPNLTELLVPGSVTQCENSLVRSSITKVYGVPGSAMEWYCERIYMPFYDLSTGEQCPMAFDVTIEGITYQVCQKYAVAISSVPEKVPTELSLPETVEGRPLTALKKWSLKNLKCTSIIIPDGVTAIEEHVFSCCVELVDVRLPETLVSIAATTFHDCRSLHTLYVPASLQEIYFNTHGIETSNPDNVCLSNGMGTLIILGYSGSFIEQRQLSTGAPFVAIQEDRTYYTAECAVYSVANGKARLDCQITPQPGLYIIPDTIAGYPVTEIYDGAFPGNENAYVEYSVYVGNNVSTIGANAFPSNSPQALYLPENVTYIDPTAIPQNALVLIYGFRSSYAETFARENGYPFFYMPSQFTDVDGRAYYAAPVAWAVNNGITNGMTDTTFGPDIPCSRGQVVTFLWRAAGSPAPKSATCNFTDVTPSAYYYNAMLWAVENGITTGTSQTTFAPNDTCTRGQVVTFLWRTAGKATPSSTTCNFTDVSLSAFYYNAMLWAVENGITTGTSQTSFAPNASCTRAQVVTFLYRTYH